MRNKITIKNDGLHSFHNHSYFSDGKCSPEQMVAAAKAAGFQEFGLSDHWVIPPEERGYDVYSWRLQPQRIGEYFARLEALKKQYNDESFTLYAGLEVDYFPENIHSVAAELAQMPLDYVIGASHFSGTFSIDLDKAAWASLSQKEIDDIIATYCDKVEGIVACGVFDILAHVDLFKIFGYTPSFDTDAWMRRVLTAARDKGMAVEINTAGWDKLCKVSYPAPHYWPLMRELGVKTLISADAHKTQQINRYFDRVAETLQSLSNSK